MSTDCDGRLEEGVETDGDEAEGRGVCGESVLEECEEEAARWLLACRECWGVEGACMAAIIVDGNEQRRRPSSSLSSSSSLPVEMDRVEERRGTSSSGLLIDHVSRFRPISICPARPRQALASVPSRLLPLLCSPFPQTHCYL